jgi:type I restriction enzyme S subunit
MCSTKQHNKQFKTSCKSHYQNWPYEIPNGWEWIRLEDLLTLLSGQDFPPEKYNERGDGIPYVIGASNIENEELIINRWTDSPSVISIPNDILIVCKGSGVGKIAKNNIGKVHIARQIQAIRDETETIESEYIKICIYNNISDIISKANGLIPGLKRELLLSLSLPIPPLQEQKRIVSVVKEYLSLMESIETNTFDLQSAIGKAKKIVLNLAIQGELVPQDPDEEPAIELLKRINPNIKIPCDNPHYQKLPDGWSIIPMQTICELSDGKMQEGIQRINLDVKFLRGKNDGEMIDKGKFVKAGSTMILVDGENSGEIFTTDIDGYQGSTFKLLNISNEMCRDFVLLVIRSHQKKFRENKVGSAIPHLNKKLFKEIPVMIPPLDEQRRIVAMSQLYLSVLNQIEEDL